MQQTLITRLASLCARHEELSRLLAQPEVVNDQNRYRDLSREYASLSDIVTNFRAYEACEKELLQNRELLAETHDPEFKELVNEEILVLQRRLEDLELKLRDLLVPKDASDERNVFLEIRAGAGGDEAALFAGDLLRMYARYAEARGWQLEIINANQAELGGYREVITRISGRGVYARLKFESGVHRVQRVPATEAQGRIHTSTCTVAVLPEAEEIDAIEINPNELKVDTFRSSGAGGQHVNVTDSAIRITHLPTGLVVECQDERSQHKNRLRAMSLLSARLLALKQREQQESEAATRKSLVGTGDRSERIRTYNFPQGRLTDHRINLTLYQLERILDGELDPLIGPLIEEHRAEQLAASVAEKGG